MNKRINKNRYYVCSVHEYAEENTTERNLIVHSGKSEAEVTMA